MRICRIFLKCDALPSEMMKKTEENEQMNGFAFKVLHTSELPLIDTTFNNAGG